MLQKLLNFELMITVCLFDTEMLNILTINLDFCAIFQNEFGECIHLHSLVTVKLEYYFNYLKIHKSSRKRTYTIYVHKIVVHSRVTNQTAGNAQRRLHGLPVYKVSWWSIRAVPSFISSCNMFPLHMCSIAFSIWK